MKSILLSTILTINALCSFSQNTTQEEYNFMDKGFKTMLESGLDMKKGYVLKDTISFSALNAKYQIVFVNMIREKNRSFAGTIAVVSITNSSKKYFLAIPAADEEGHLDLEGTLMKSISNSYWDTNLKSAFIQSMAEYMSIIMTKRYMVKAKK